MPTETELQKALAAAMKARAADEVNVLRGLITAIKNLKVEKMAAQLGDADIVGIVRKELKKCEEAMDFARKGNRPDLVEENQRQKAVLEKYLPPQLGRDELETIVRQIAAELGSPEIGPIMAKLRERHAGQFDGQVASQVIRSLPRAGS